MTTKVRTSRRLTRYLAVPTVALGLAIGSAAVANAGWDVEAFRTCVAQMPGSFTPDQSLAWRASCCGHSGGVWGHETGSCGAPRAARNPLTDGAPTHVIQPSPLPGQGPVIAPPPSTVG
jgi:hypothetical protein